MRIKSFKVSGVRYTVKAVKGLMANENIYGRCHKSSKQIFVDSELKGEALQLTLIHELTHALIHEVAADQAIHWSLEEVICEAVAKAMVGNIDFKI